MIGDRQLSPEEASYREEASRAIRALIPPDLPERMDRNEILYPTDYLRIMAKHHYLGVQVPRELNGGGLTILHDALVNELAGYWGSATLACARSFTSHGGYILWKYGSPHLHEQYLRPTLAGERFVCQALTEQLGHAGVRALLHLPRRLYPLEVWLAAPPRAVPPADAGGRAIRLSGADRAARPRWRARAPSPPTAVISSGSMARRTSTSSTSGRRWRASDSSVRR